ncbi:MAG TPA: tetratricopeptide repeat protein [Sphingopyxis sp.]|nr:tetratricopeptide repeat protein [Sphingopyxis sp.]HMP43798.1 tetratricopeptide repeat protein [Sphingopyxis sp.]HMQ19036.1 tetratricopeptide repeat protein [Sphingopyxis sp.]
MRLWRGCAALLLAMLSLPAYAAWHRVETAEFALQADMEPAELRRIGAQLIEHDRLLRQVLGISGPGRGRRLEIILHGDRARLVEQAGLPEEFSGLFHANPVENFALIPVADSEDRDHDIFDILRHEYAHYFMMRHMGHWQPAWYIEGFASFFETAQRGPDGIMRYGAAPPVMASFLKERGGLSFAQLASVAHSRANGFDRRKFYAQGWLITSHYYLGGPQAPGIDAYLGAASKGRKADPAVFAGGAEQLDRDVKAWFKAGLPAPREIAVDPVDPASIAIRPLSAGEIALVDLRFDIYRRMSQITEIDEAYDVWSAITSNAKALVAAHPMDRPVGTYLAKLLLSADIGETSSDEIAAMIDPEGTATDDRILQARLAARRANEGPPARFERGILAARSALEKILQVEPDNVDALFAMYDNIREAEGASPRAIGHLARALDIDPTNVEWRMRLFELYLRNDRTADAIRLLEPIANLPHGGADAEMAADLIRTLRSGR